ncbi:hypothetical protein B5V90_02910 [Heyndrickxia sporothermodurans]|nr:hypothetical protein B5V90_02910 [Heyndrickxia sporothermodurans]
MRAIVFIEGGAVQEVMSDEGMEILIVDRDTEGVDLSELRKIAGDDAYVYSTRGSSVNKEKIKEIYKELEEQESSLQEENE